MNAYTLDFVANTITITADFAKAMNAPTSAEYQIIAQIRKDFPQMKIVRKTHATPRKYTSKATGETTRCNQFKNLTYKNMESFINGLSNSEDYLKPYNFLKDCGSLPATSRYTLVRKWFTAQFPEYRKNPLFYLYNQVAVIDIAQFVEEQKRAETAQKAS